jgi:hypothetical protein
MLTHLRAQPEQAPRAGIDRFAGSGGASLAGRKLAPIYRRG